MQSEPVNTTNTMLNYTGNSTAQSDALFSDSLELMSFILSVLGITANIIAILATARVPSVHTTHSKLIISLCVSDGLVLIAIPLIYLLENCKNLYRPILYIALIATLINLLAMALDHYVAIMRPLHHKSLLSSFRGCCIVLGIWAFSITAGLLEFIVSLATTSGSGDNTSICTIIVTDQYDLEMFIICFIFVVLLIILIIYTRIYFRLKRHALVGIPRQQTSKALVTTIILIGTFMVCWAPMGIYQIYMNLLFKTDVIYLIEHFKELYFVNKVLLIVLQLNSLADPLIYAIRLPQVRRGCQAVFSIHRCRGKQEISLPLSPVRDVGDQFITVIND